ncbi:hypothetical protein PHLGIDRAFT_97602 [Phlebiopsis gigantea 11061_1 CR5-6]|uniref:F-box domain-containing protein n=1 Tax=Phlebiopsis gigantea (strain 11061_1 CR5-6) TaxID=745531 RepID=A0A0C3SEM4_PHLG1|nr:hypothetical protein PHLGIDRAFT_97602 [Phlebiopsis gigantea 11061_1 CR5-6]
MSLTSLPAELLEAVFAPLVSHTLAALARTNGDLYASATRLLYRDVALSSFASNLSAVRTLATRSHLSQLVRSFSICMEEGRDQVDEAYSPALLHRALRGMEHLTHLEVHVDAGQSCVLFDDARSPDFTHYPNLQSFSCSFPLDAHVARFLEGTPALRSLQVSPSPDAANLARTAVPLLDTYTGPPCALAQLLPSRPITTLLLSGDLTLAHIELLADGRIANSLASLPLLGAFELGGMHWEFRPRSTSPSSLDGICPEKEWLSPPVSPRSADTLALHDNDYDFDNAFMEWAY